MLFRIHLPVLFSMQPYNTNKCTLSIYLRQSWFVKIWKLKNGWLDYYLRLPYRSNVRFFCSVKLFLREDFNTWRGAQTEAGSMIVFQQNPIFSKVLPSLVCFLGCRAFTITFILDTSTWTPSLPTMYLSRPLICFVDSQFDIFNFNSCKSIIFYTNCYRYFGALELFKRRWQRCADTL